MRIADLYGIAMLFYLSSLGLSEKCGPSNKCQAGFITNGENTCSRAYPWNAALVVPSSLLSSTDVGLDIFCGGTIISKTFVLSAAHCFRYGRQNLDRQVDNVRVYVGLDNRVRYTVGHEYHYVRRVKIHEDWLEHLDGFNRGNDLALLELQSEIVLTENVAKICLPTKQQEYLIEEGKMTQLPGFGLNSTSSRYNPHKLQEGRFEIVDCEEPNNICAAKVEEGKVISTTCHGDSGGGLVASDNGSNFLVGVVSWGQQGCDFTNFPTRYVNIFDHLPWIRSKMEKCRTRLGSTCILPYKFNQKTYDECISRDPSNPNRTIPAKCPTSLDSRGEGAGFEHCDENCPGFKHKVNGQWLNWGEWSGCSAICGGGLKTRSRTCTTPQFGGDRCGFAYTERESCNMQECAGPSTTTTTVLWIANFGQTIETLKLPDFTPVNASCKVPTPNMDLSYSNIQEIQGKLYSCDPRLCQTYSAEDNTWKTIPGKRFKFQRQRAAGTVVGDKWIVQGGKARENGKAINVKTAEVWSPGTGNWAEAPQYKSPLPVYGHCVVNINGKIMQIGGLSEAPGAYTDKCFVDGGEVASLKAPRSYHSCAVFHGEVWVAGGNGVWHMDFDVRVVEIYNPQSKNWTEGAKLPGEIKADTNPLLVTYEGNLYYVGGHAISKIYQLNIDQFKWEEVGDIAKGQKWGHIVNTKVC